MIILRTRNFDDTKNTTSGQPVRRLSSAEVMTLKGSVTKALNNTTIGKTYIKDLIETVAENTNGTIVSTDILDLFTKVFEVRGDNYLNGGVWIYQKGSDSSSAAKVWDYVNGRGYAEIYLAFSGDITWEQGKLPAEQQIVPRYESLIRRLVDPQTGGMPTIHELMHVAIKGRKKGTTWAVADDIDYADAAAALAGDENPSYKQAKYPGSAGSGYWGERLNQACGYPSHLTHKMTNYVLYAPEVPIQKTLPGTIA